MKKIILATLVVMSAAVVSAQDIPERKAERPVPHHGGGHKGMKKHHGMDMQALNLTDAQKEQMKANREQFHKQMQELKKNDNITVKEYRSKMEQLQKEQKAGMDKILTTEQKDKMKKMREEGQAKRKEMMDKRGEKMKEKLGLTADQSAKLDKQRADMRTQMKAINENKALSDDQKKEQMKELHKKQKESLKSILTEEQLQKMKEGRKHGPHNGEKPKEKKLTT